MPPTPAPILIIGIAVVDAIARPINAFPSPGGLRFFDDLTFTTGGCAVNSSIALARLGTPPHIIARIGRDPLGDFVLAELAGNNISTANIIRDPARPTSFSFVAVPTGGERSFLHTTGANASLNPSDIPPALLNGKTIVFITGAMLMDSLDGLPAADLLRAARAAGAQTILDTVYIEAAPREQWQSRILPALPHLDYFIPSVPEASVLAGTPDPSLAAQIFQDHGARNIIIKLGARGVLCRDHTGHETTIPAFKVPHVVDATGAGDCWAAGFLLGLHQGRSFTESARLGNAVAAISIQSPGATTGLQSMDQVNAIMHA